MKRLPPNTATLLRAAGLTVVEIPRWLFRSRPGSTNFTGVLNHHTGASAKGWSRDRELSYARWMFLTGRSDLPAPLCQIALGRSGVVYLGAAGRANHAGVAKASGSIAAGDGNALYIGIEWMLSGTEEIPAHMMKAGEILNAVLTKKILKTSAETISAHYQTSVTGKWDIGDPNGIPFKGAKVLDVEKFRARVSGRRAEIDRSEKPVKKPKNVVGLSWNLLTGRNPGVVAGELKALIRANRRPEFVALQEAITYRGAIKAAALATRYRVYQPKNAELPPGSPITSRGREGGSTVLMVRRNVKVRNHGVIRCEHTWKGPKHGVIREGRVLPWVEALIDSKWVLVVSVHMPTGKNTQRNKAAWDETISRIETLAKKKGLPFQLIGDWNMLHSDDGKRTPRALAERLGGRVENTTTNLDYALVRNQRVRVTKAAKRGSDHHAIRSVRKKP